LYDWRTRPDDDDDDDDDDNEEDGGGTTNRRRRDFAGICLSCSSPCSTDPFFPLILDFPAPHRALGTAHANARA
jgi:hypothetical protein